MGLKDQAARAHQAIRKESEMTGFNYIINLTVVNGSAFAKLAGMAQGFETSLDRVQSEVDQTQSKVSNLGRTGQNVFSGLRSSVMSWVAGLGIGLATLGSLQAAAQNEGLTKSIEFAGGADGAKNLAYVRSEVDRLGLPLKESLDGFKTLSGAMMGTGFAAEQQQKIFTGLAEGIATFRLPAEQSNRALLALAQMASKGTVSSEELKGQLGEALPGAFNVAARAMGVSTTALNKMLEDGEVMASDFLPKFAAEMHKTFGQSAIEATTGATANFNRLQNSIYELNVMVGERLMPTVLSLINDYLIPAVDWIGKNIDALGLLATIVGGVWAAFKLYNITAALSALATGGLTASVEALTVAFYANPIGIIVGALVAIGAAVYYAWNHFEGFRAALYGVWEVLKPVASFLADVFTFNFRMLGAAIKWVWDLTEGMRNGFSQWMDSLKSIGSMIWEKLIKPFTVFGKVVTLLQPLFSAAGSAISETFTEGWNKGIADFAGPSGAAGGNNALATAAFAGPGAGGPGAGAGGGKASKIADSITSGGQRNVTINVGKLNEGGITINTTNLKEGSADVEAMMMKIFLQVVNSANQTQGR